MSYLQQLWSTQQLCALRCTYCHVARYVSTSTAVVDDAVSQKVLVTLLLSWAVCFLGDAE